MKSIYIACLHLGHGGIEMAVCTLANALSLEGYQVELLCTYHLGEPAYPLEDNVKVTYLTRRKPNRAEIAQAWSRKNPIAAVRELTRAAKTIWAKYSSMKKAFKGVCSGTVISSRHEYSLLLSKFGNSSVLKIAQLHQDHRCSSKLARQIGKGYGNIHCLVLPTRQAARELQNLLEELGSDLRCVPIPHFLMESQTVLVAEKKKQVLAVGRLHPEKGFDRMLRIWAKVSPACPDFTLKIVGEGGEYCRLEEICRQYKIERSVTFAGALPHDLVLQEMAGCWCFFMTSREESFGYVLIEAMSCGTPVLAFDVRTGPREIIQDGENGYLIEDGDEERMAAQLIQMLREKARCEALGRRAKETAKRFEKNSILQKWIELIER